MAPSVLRSLCLWASFRAACGAGEGFLSSSDAGRRLSEPTMGTWTPVDGGTGRVCRRTSPTDNSDSYFTLRNEVASLQDCQGLCQAEAACTGVEFWELWGRCELWKASINASEESPGFNCWRFVKAVNVSERTGFVEQSGARIPVGGDIKLYAVGSSNVPWQTWVDQLHMTLKDLGYNTPTIRAKHPDTLYHPYNSVPKCDDVASYRELETPRIGKIGWASWGFAFEDESDCSEDGFRQILTHQVGCVNAWACNPKWIGPGQKLIRPSEIAEDARHSQVTVLSNWMNDGKQRHAKNVCYNGENILPVKTTEITLVNLLRVIRTIHARNPDVVVAVLALYPDAYHSNGVIIESSLEQVHEINAAVEAGLRDEPNTLFVKYNFPLKESMFQGPRHHPGHANCRGDKVLAQSIVDALFRAKVIARGLGLSDDPLCLASDTCEGLSVRCCQSAALCRVDGAGTCVAYSPGR